MALAVSMAAQMSMSMAVAVPVSVTGAVAVAVVVVTVTVAMAIRVAAMQSTMAQAMKHRVAGASRRVCAAVLALAAAGAQALGIPPAYLPIVIEPAIGADQRVEFDLSPALARAQREHKRLYVYLGASDCPYCRRYEAFLDRNAAELVPHFKPYLVVDLRSSLATTSQRLFIRAGARSLPYADFQRSIGDERARLLVYPSVWLFDAQLEPLMQMPAGTGTFQTVDEQLEILQLVQ